LKFTVSIYHSQPSKESQSSKVNGKLRIPVLRLFIMPIRPIFPLLYNFDGIELSLIHRWGTTMNGEDKLKSLEAISSCFFSFDKGAPLNYPSSKMWDLKTHSIAVPFL